MDKVTFTTEELENPGPTANPVEDELIRLALLSNIDYDRERQAAADALNIRVGTLDDEVKARRPKSVAAESDNEILLTSPEPWPDTVDINVLLCDIVTAIKRFVVLTESAAIAAGLWVLHTYCHGASNVSPLLAITSPAKRCGKTTLLELLTALVNRPLPTSNLTSATIFRGIEAFHPTLLIDEADTFIREGEELRGILNSGHRRSTAVVLRCDEGDNFAVKRFSTWCPKAIAAIGKLPDTLQDRSVVIALRRRGPGECVDGLRFDRVSNELYHIRRKSARWATDNESLLADSEPLMSSQLDDRAADNWRALLAIADAAGNHWPETARTAALELSGTRDEEDDSTGTMLLADIKAIFTTKHADKLSSAEIVAVLAEMENRPWPEWRNSKPITPNQLSRLLKPFKIASKSVRIGDSTPKGYELESFKDAFCRYLSPSGNATPPQTNTSKGFSDLSKRNTPSSVADEKTDKSSAVNNVADVADETGKAEERI